MKDVFLIFLLKCFSHFLIIYLKTFLYKFINLKKTTLLLINKHNILYLVVFLQYFLNVQKFIMFNLKIMILILYLI